MPAMKVAISLPEQLLRWVDAECARLGLTRSEFIRRALRTAFERLDEQAADDAYAESYRLHPEDTALNEAFTKLAAEAFVEDPWE